MLRTLGKNWILFRVFFIYPYTFFVLFDKQVYIYTVNPRTRITPRGLIYKQIYFGWGLI